MSTSILQSNIKDPLDLSQQGHGTTKAVPKRQWSGAHLSPSASFRQSFSQRARGEDIAGQAISRLQDGTRPPGSLRSPRAPRKATATGTRQPYTVMEITKIACIGSQVSSSRIPRLRRPASGLIPCRLSLASVRTWFDHSTRSTAQYRARYRHRSLLLPPRVRLESAPHRPGAKIDPP